MTEPEVIAAQRQAQKERMTKGRPMAASRWIPTPDPGIHPGIPAEVYHRWDAMSQSQIKPLSRSPRQLLTYRRKGIDTPALRLGSLTDTLVFEPEHFSDRFIVRPGTYKTAKGEVKTWNGNAHICKDMLAQYEASGLTIVTPDQHRLAALYAKAVREKAPVKRLLSGGEAQVSVVWDDPSTGIRCKMRIDWLCQFIADLKTTVDASLEGWPQQCSRFKYHVQGAMYIDGYRAVTGRELDFCMIAVEKDGPYDVGLYRFEEESLVAGRNIYKRALFTYRQCLSSGQWSGYSDYIEPINLPRYALVQELGAEVVNVGF